MSKWLREVSGWDKLVAERWKWLEVVAGRSKGMGSKWLRGVSGCKQ